jgi:cation:H+ antiporter
VTGLLLAGAFAVILVGALLFTNAVEWLGHRLELGSGAVGSVLAAVATALPESTIPVVAIVGGKEGGDDVAVGAIIGAPFMLATVAMALVGLAAIAYAGRREQGRELRAHPPTLKRDLLVFLALLGVAVLLGLGAPLAVRVVSAVALVLAYAAYVVVTVRRGGQVQQEESLDPLAFDPTRHDPPPTGLIAVQFLVGLSAIIGGAHLFVEHLLATAREIGVDALVLSLLLAPLATELPEKANSFLWVRQGKDALALGNITGAMVFQSTIPVAVALAFTPWQLQAPALLAAGLALAGGTIAVWTLHIRRRFSVAAIVLWSGLFAVFAVALGFI